MKKTKYKSRWQTRDGDIFRIEDMELSHIVNCMNMIKKGVEVEKDAAYCVASFVIGDMAEYCIEQEITAFEEDDSHLYPEVYYEFLDEIHERGEERWLEKKLPSVILKKKKIC